MRMSLFRMRLPELEQFPPGDRQAALDRCGQTAEVQRLRLWYLWLARSILLGLAAGAALSFGCRWLDYYPDWLFPVLFTMPFAAILGFLGLLLWYRSRLTAELR